MSQSDKPDAHAQELEELRAFARALFAPASDDRPRGISAKPTTKETQ